MGFRGAIWITLVLAAGPALAQKVHIDYDQNADFENYETFAWYRSPDTSVESSNELVHRRIVEIIENQLVAGGLRLVDSNPDLYVTYHTNSKEEMSLNTTHFGYGYPAGWAWDPYWGGWGGAGMAARTPPSTPTPAAR